MARMESGEGTFQWHQLQLTPTSTEQEVEQVLAHYACWEAGSFQWTCLARDLMRLTGALFLVLSEYCPERKSLITRGIEGIPQKVEAVIHQLGHPVMGYEWVLADGVYETLQEERLHRLDSLHEVSSYHIPEFVGFTIEKLLELAVFTAWGFFMKGSCWAILCWPCQRDKHFSQSNR